MVDLPAPLWPTNADLIAVVDSERHIVERTHDHAFRGTVAAAPQYTSDATE